MRGMKLSKAVVPIASGVASLGVLATCGLLLIQNGTRSQNTPIVDQHVAAVSTSATHSTSHAVVKPAAVVPRSTVVVKNPTVQGATVTDPTSSSGSAAAAPATTPAAPEPVQSSNSEVTVQTDPPTTDPNGVVHAPAPSIGPTATPSGH